MTTIADYLESIRMSLRKALDEPGATIGSLRKSIDDADIEVREVARILGIKLEVSWHASEADKRLIIAAPDLLKDCELVEGVLRGRGEFDWFDIHVRLAVQDAIAKATGRPA